MIAIFRSVAAALLLVLLVPIVNASDIAVSASGSGDKSGSDWSNAADWSSMFFIRGNTYYLADGTYVGKAMNTAVSGVTVITIKKATVAVHGPATGWADSMGDGQTVFSNAKLAFQTSNWILDGSIRSTDNTGHGFKVVGAAGAGAYGISLATGVHDNISIRYTEVTSPNTPISDNCVDQNLCTDKGIYAILSPANLLVEYSYIHDVCVPVLVNGSTGFIFRNSVIERNDSEASHHSEAFSLNGGSNMTINNNKFIDIEGTAFISFMNGGDPDNVAIYNNLSYDTVSKGIGNGWITCTNTGTVCTNFYIYGNTTINVPNANSSVARIDIGSGGSASNWTVKNNLWWCDTGACGAAVNDNGAGFVYGNNWYGGVTHNESEAGHINGGSENPFSDSANHDFTLTAGSTPIDNGASLGSPYNVDPLGVSRPEGAYDIGAYEYNAGQGDTVPDAFTFTDNTGAALSTVIYSTSVTVAGIDNTTAISLTGAGCEYRVNAGSWITSGDNVALNDNVALRTTSSGSYNTATSCVLTIGGVSDTWSATTAAAVEVPTAPRMQCGTMTGGWR